MLPTIETISTLRWVNGGCTYKCNLVLFSDGNIDTPSGCVCIDAFDWDPLTWAYAEEFVESAKCGRTRTSKSQTPTEPTPMTIPASAKRTSFGITPPVAVGLTASLIQTPRTSILKLTNVCASTATFGMSVPPPAGSSALPLTMPMTMSMSVRAVAKTTINGMTTQKPAVTC